MSVYGGPGADGFPVEKFAMPSGNMGPFGFKGDLLIFYGTADDNTHSTNSLQLIKALQAAGKHFVVQVSPDGGHDAISFPRAMEFLIHSLVVKPKFGLVY